MAKGFIQISMTRRKRGRPSARRFVTVRLADGSSVRIGDGVPKALVRFVLDVLTSDCRKRRRRTC